MCVHKRGGGVITLKEADRVAAVLSPTDTSGDAKEKCANGLLSLIGRSNGRCSRERGVKLGNGVLCDVFSLNIHRLLIIKMTERSRRVLYTECFASLGQWDLSVLMCASKGKRDYMYGADCVEIAL